MNWKEQFEQAIKRQLCANAALVLESYFEVEVAKRPQLLKELFAMRAQIKTKKHRFSVSELFSRNKKLATKVFSQMGGSLQAFLPDNRSRKPAVLKKLGYRYDNTDFIRLMQPFVGRDQLSLRLLGVTYADNYIAATDAFQMLYLPTNPTDNRGVYCITKACFENADGDKINQSPPSHQQIIPKLDDQQQGYVVQAEQWYALIGQLENTGFESDKVGKAVVAGLKHGDSIVYVNLSMLKKSFRAFLQLGYEKVLLFFFGAEKAIVMLPHKGFDRNAYNAHQQIFTMTMPISMKDNPEPYYLDIDLDSGSYGMTVAQDKTDTLYVSRLDQSKGANSTLVEARDALRTALEFSDNKTALQQAIDALDTAIEFI